MSTTLQGSWATLSHTAHQPCPRAVPTAVPCMLCAVMYPSRGCTSMVADPALCLWRHTSPWPCLLHSILQCLLRPSCGQEFSELLFIWEVLNLHPLKDTLARCGILTWRFFFALKMFQVSGLCCFSWEVAAVHVPVPCRWHVVFLWLLSGFCLCLWFSVANPASPPRHSERVLKELCTEYPDVHTRIPSPGHYSAFSHYF